MTEKIGSEAVIITYASIYYCSVNWFIYFPGSHSLNFSISYNLKILESLVNSSSYIGYLINKGSPIIAILSRIKPVPRTDTHFFKIYSNIVLPSTPRPR